MITNPLRFSKKLALLSVIVVQLAWITSSAFVAPQVVAVESTTSSTEVVDPATTCPEYSGISSPTGASSGTFAFNAASCLWENEYYTWSPVTKAYTAKYEDAPIYNIDSGCHDTTTWVYVSSKGEYQKRVTENCPVEVLSTNTKPTSSESLPNGGYPTGWNGSNYTGSSTISNTGPNSNNSIDSLNNTDIDLKNANNVNILTTLNSNATSGEASVINNTTGGSAKSGDAQTIANMLNMLQSSWDPMYGDISTFSASLLSDYFGDLVFNPKAINNSGPNSKNTISEDNETNLTINNETNANITNNVNMNSTSGDATVSGNTTGGNATSGDASAIANIVNMINSMITAGKSFFGSIDLYGNLDGDILLPDSLLAQIMNTGPNSDNSINSTTNNNLGVNNDNNFRITNNSNLSATSGDANVTNNTTGGSATTGDAETNINQYNLIGQNISARNGLMVFVNVLGSWVGFLFDAPTGTSSILGTGPSSTNSIDSDNNINADINNTNNYSITNNLDLNSRTGNATVSNNTTGGSATSGNASSSVNLLNMINSRMTFDDWFGVLFINVFGNWNGSFGVDTIAGEKPKGGQQGGESPANAVKNEVTNNKSASSTSAAGTANYIANFVASSQGQTNWGNNINNDNENKTATSSTATDDSSLQDDFPDALATINDDGGGISWFAIIAVFAALLLLFGERIMALVRPKA